MRSTLAPVLVLLFSGCVTVPVVALTRPPRDEAKLAAAAEAFYSSATLPVILVHVGVGVQREALAHHALQGAPRGAVRCL